VLAVTLQAAAVGDTNAVHETLTQCRELISELAMNPHEDSAPFSHVNQFIFGTWNPAELERVIGKFSA